MAPQVRPRNQNCGIQGCPTLWYWITTLTPTHVLRQTKSYCEMMQPTGCRLNTSLRVSLSLHHPLCPTQRCKEVAFHRFAMGCCECPGKMAYLLVCKALSLERIYSRRCTRGASIRTWIRIQMTRSWMLSLMIYLQKLLRGNGFVLHMEVMQYLAGKWIVVVVRLAT